MVPAASIEAIEKNLGEERKLADDIDSTKASGKDEKKGKNQSKTPV